jgi:endonuclease/exonuclease/phosphatase family metal-dependent hydrolase
MKLIHHNILDGCAGDDDRRDAIGRWLQRQQADVVTLNELNGWQVGDALAAFGRRWGFGHAALGRVAHSEYPVGLLSRWPIDDVRVVGRPFHHALLQVRIGALQIWVAHLAPTDAVQRGRECAWLTEQLRGVDAPLLLAGDLNTLSPLDADAHARTALLPALQASAVLRRKFLTPQGAIDHRPMQTLLDAGLHDLRAPGQPQTSVPTPLNRDPAHAVPMRLDYLLANAAFMRFDPVGQIESGDEVSMLSDHRPVVAQWCSAGEPVASSASINAPAAAQRD